MEVMAQEIETIPSGNIRVPRAEFVEVWMRAEALSDGQTLQGRGAWYLAGVAVTCRWLANARVRAPGGPWEPAPGPASGRVRASEGNIGDEAAAIEAEVVAAAESSAELTLEVSALMGMRAAFAWAWWAIAPAPVDVSPAGTRRAPTG